MPIYSYECSQCKEISNAFRKIDDRHNGPVCCGIETKLKIMPTMINFDMPNWERYESPVSGKLITSYKERKADMEEHGCVDYEPSMRKHATKNMEDCDRKLEKKMDETVEAEIQKMPARKKEKLDQELDNAGAEVVYERR